MRTVTAAGFVAAAILRISTASAADDAGLRYGVDLTVGSVLDEDGAAWAAGGQCRVGVQIDRMVALYGSAHGLVGPYMRVGGAAVLELATTDLRTSFGLGVATTPKVQKLCSDQPCGPNAFLCFEPCEDNGFAFTTAIRIAPRVPLPTIDTRLPFSLAFEVQVDFEPEDGEIRALQLMSFAYDEVVGKRP